MIIGRIELMIFNMKMEDKKGALKVFDSKYKRMTNDIKGNSTNI